MLAASLPFLLTTACKNDLDRVRAIEVAPNGPDRITSHAEYLYSDSGVVRNRIRAGTISEYEGDQPHTELGQGVELTFFDVQGRSSGRLTARKGRILPGKNRMEVEEDVVFVNARGEKLETEQLTWAQDSGRVFTDRPVKVTRSRDIIYGQGLDAAQDLSWYTIRRITGTLFLDRSDTLGPKNRNP
jgi:LPS export ABC transporter protein LptC